MEQVRFGVIGIVNMGNGHVSCLYHCNVKGAVLTAVCDIKPDRLEWADKETNGSVAKFTDYKELLKSGLVDAVIIAVPHYLHPVIGMEAFEAGINVLTEKPIGVYTKAAEDFIKSASAHKDLTFGIMYNQRTNPCYQKMRELVQNGELGTLKRCVWLITDWYRTQAYYNSGGWRATYSGEGGGVLLNQCPHNLDLWQWIFGMPCRVRGFCHFGEYHDIEVEDNVTAYVEYPNGASGLFVTTTGEFPGTNRLEVSGSRGKLVCEHGKLTFYRNSIDEREYTFASEQGFQKPSTETIEYQFENSGAQHQGILQNYTNHLLYGEPLLAPGEEGINGLSLSNAMVLSTWKDKWVELPNDGEEYWEELKKHIATSKGKEKIAETVVTDMSASFNI